jgi:hypothetical protein
MLVQLVAIPVHAIDYLFVCLLRAVVVNLSLKMGGGITLYCYFPFRKVLLVSSKTTHQNCPCQFSFESTSIPYYQDTLSRLLPTLVRSRDLWLRLSSMATYLQHRSCTE